MKRRGTARKEPVINLRQKVCIACDRPFSWRKKWKRCWAEVKFCSKRCQSVGRRQFRQDNNNGK
ncbi:DUF2256 domain-containing protein [uncultured Endozoicomonas sp.]|uniref:DUF2256 domain-containing protein n=1 Tax=uncultured Endozoicomonas sp. TaxID=432652 RepID=UPI002632AAC9|nr:DUF2256 domain-containing protein [uncultured Endozoicomonas sp.]